MRIGVDVRCLAEGRRTGVEEYTLNLLSAIFRKDKENEYILFFNSYHDTEVDFSWANFPNVKIRRFRLPNKLLNLTIWYLGWPKIDKLLGEVDVFFAPNIAFLALSKKTELILTIHDLSFERYPHFFSWKRKLWHAFINPKKLSERANKIIAVSDSTKKDLEGMYKIDSRKITVIPSAISKKFRVIDRNEARLLETKERYKLPYKFVLYFGTIEPRKNVIGTIRAFNAFQEYALSSSSEELARYNLVLAGSPGWLSSKIIREISESSHREKIRVINFVYEEDKEYFYNLASLFIYPSFFEGFGFPPLEAERSGVPVIASNNSSLPEIMRQSAVLIDPDKPEDIFRAMREILKDKKLQEKLVERGKKNAEKFNWDRSAQSFLKIIKK